VEFVVEVIVVLGIIRYTCIEPVLLTVACEPWTVGSENELRRAAVARITDQVSVEVQRDSSTLHIQQAQIVASHARSGVLSVVTKTSRHIYTPARMFLLERIPRAANTCCSLVYDPQ
jgi:hypothetical protein